MVMRLHRTPPHGHGVLFLGYQNLRQLSNPLHRNQIFPRILPSGAKAIYPQLVNPVAGYWILVGFLVVTLEGGREPQTTPRVKSER